VISSGFIMNRSIVFMVVATLLAGCGPSQRERQAAWVQAFQLERDAVYQQWEADVGRRGFSTDAAAVQDLKVRYEKVYARWMLPMDLLTQALLSYTVALANRVDRGEIGREESIRLCDRLKAEIDVGRGTLGGETTWGQRETAEREWWERFWREHQEAYRASTRNPIRCAVLSNQVAGGSVTCE
jgi:hypothetical protein